MFGNIRLLPVFSFPAQAADLMLCFSFSTNKMEGNSQFLLLNILSDKPAALDDFTTNNEWVLCAYKVPCGFSGLPCSLL